METKLVVIPYLHFKPIDVTLCFFCGNDVP
jgi:hypothetical protein